jgi:regulator of RNase E activity RraA
VKNLTIFSAGYSPKDIKGRGRVEATDVGIRIGNVPIRPGDWLFGDCDGVVVVPLEGKAALEKRIRRIMENEGSIKRDIRGGMTVAKILGKYKEF